MVTTNPFSAMFGRSPFQPLLAHIVKTHECANYLLPFFEATLAGDWGAAAECRESIMHLEHEADELKTELRCNLPNTIFLPVSRTDLLDLISVQDKIANKVRDITGIMLGRRCRCRQPWPSRCATTCAPRWPAWLSRARPWRSSRICSSRASGATSRK